MSAVALQSFGFGDQLVRTLERDGGIWFVANDVCSALDIGNSRQAVSRLEDDEKGVTISDTLGGRQELTIVSESGVYALIFKSRKPIAVTFRKWVTGEVLPALRRHGRYGMVDDVTTNDAIALPIDWTDPHVIQDKMPVLALVREVRQVWGRKAAQKAWLIHGLPDPFGRDQAPTAGFIPRPVDDSVRAWAEERLVTAPGQRVRSGELWTDYQRWADQSHVHDRAGLPTFGHSLTQMGIQSMQSNGIWRLNVALAD